ncbi:response regulator [Thermodesulfobacteriota bacterium]
MAKVLIAEDDVNVLGLFSSVVDSLGHTAIKCHNGKVALDIVSDNYDIAMLIVDYKMPEMDGGQLVKRVREQKGFDRVPILIVSSVIRPKDIAHLLELGATYFLPKPVDMQQLKDFVNKNLASA